MGISMGGRGSPHTALMFLARVVLLITCLLALGACSSHRRSVQSHNTDQHRAEEGWPESFKVRVFTWAGDTNCESPQSNCSYAEPYTLEYHSEKRNLVVSSPTKGCSVLFDAAGVALAWNHTERAACAKLVPKKSSVLLGQFLSLAPRHWLAAGGFSYEGEDTLRIIHVQHKAQTHHARRFCLHEEFSSSCFWQDNNDGAPVRHRQQWEDGGQTVYEQYEDYQRLGSGSPVPIAPVSCGRTAAQEYTASSLVKAWQLACHAVP